MIQNTASMSDCPAAAAAAAAAVAAVADRPERCIALDRPRRVRRAPQVLVMDHDMVTGQGEDEEESYRVMDRVTYTQEIQNELDALIGTDDDEAVAATQYEMDECGAGAQEDGDKEGTFTSVPAADEDPEFIPGDALEDEDEDWVADDGSDDDFDDDFNDASDNRSEESWSFNESEAAELRVLA